jgi:hypothetical protein
MSGAGVLLNVSITPVTLSSKGVEPIGDVLSGREAS